MDFLVLLILLAVVIVFYILGTYNKFVTIKTRIKAAIQELGNQLKRQSELIPNLVSSVKGYMKHEKDALKMITDARKAIVVALKSKNVQKMVDASAAVQEALRPIRAVFESTPQLQAAGPTGQLMDELRDTADKLMYSRRTLIDLTADYNVMIVTFPSNLIAKIFNFKQQEGLKTPMSGEHLEVSGKEMKTPKVDL